MKNNICILLIGILVVLSSLWSIYFYQRNATTMQEQVENLFVHTLTSALHQKLEELKLPHSSWITSDTIPLTVCITTAEGVKVYQVDAEKSRKNISHNSRERSLHSVAWEESPLSLDTLNRLWTDTLHAQNIDARTMIRVSMITFHGDTLTSESAGDNSRVTFSPRFVSYIGNRCEIEATGFLERSCWAICCYHWSPFLWIWVGAAFVIFLSHSFYRLMHRPAKIEIVKEEVICEVVKEVPYEVIVEKEVIKEVPVLVKQLDHAKPKVYQLRPDLLFDAHKQLLVQNGVGVKLAPQSCIILKIFLDAPDYTLTDPDILEKVWGKRDKTIKDFTVAYARLQNLLGKVGLSASFKRVGNEQYRLFID